MELDQTHPAISDLRARAKRRIPHFVWEFLDSGTGDETAFHGNAAALDTVRLIPRVLRGEISPDPGTTFLGRSYGMPVGVAPVGMSGLMWPDAERTLARLCAETGLPYTLSTVAAQPPEIIGPVAGDMGWFQLYPPGDAKIRQALIGRARDAGFHTLVLTVDVPTASRRERQRRARLTNPMRLTPGILMQIALRPAWAIGTARAGIPRLQTLDRYAPITSQLPSTAHVGYLLRCAPDMDYFRTLRDEWRGDLVVKGILDPADAVAVRDAGADAVWVSNHGGRQFSAAPAALDALRAVRAAVGAEYPLIYDGGIRSGTDILRALAAGADFTMTGRAVHYGLGAFGARGAAHALHILRDSLSADMGQLGISRPAEARAHLPPGA